MRTAALLAVLPVLLAKPATEQDKRQYVDTTYAYTGPQVPVGDWVDPTINGNGKGFPRIVEPPAVRPCYANPTNNINVIQLSYTKGGMNVHYQTPFGIDGPPCVNFGTDKNNLNQEAKGSSATYARTPSCSMVDDVTQCNEFFHSIDITGLQDDTVYYYQIPGSNGTSQSDVLSFRTAKAAGSEGAFTLGVIHDMGYTNAHGTRGHLARAADKGEITFAIHGGDISYADDWYSGILPCELTGPDAWPLCYNGTWTTLPENLTAPEYLNAPLPEGEIPNQGGPQGGDISVIYETNWDRWQQWMSVAVTSKIPYMVAPGNHEAACAEFDGPNNELTAYLNNDQANSTAKNSSLTYYTCPPSQRNFTAYNHRWSFPSTSTPSAPKMWYSYDVGLAHFISFDAETDYPNSPEKSFLYDLTGNETHPMENETYITNSGPFGAINGSYKVKESYEQYQWMKADLAAVNRTKTPWIIAYSHRPMYSSEVSSYQKNMRAAWEDLFLQYKVDAHLAGHIHWYERLFPLAPNATIVQDNIINNHTYISGNGKSLVHLTNGQAGNIESHSFLTADEPKLNITAYLDQQHFGFSKLSVLNATAAKWQFIHGEDGTVGDEVWLVKQ